MDIITELEQAEKEQALSIPAKRLIEKLLPLSSKEEQTARRWFWELLQNASDYNDSVSVRLDITNDMVTFSHDGAPFSVGDVYNLISPDSGKDSDEVKRQNIGRFGSGLVSTHVLSAIIEVKGAFRSKGNELYSFCFHLDRSHFKSKELLINDIEQTKVNFKQSHQPINKENYKGYMTRFSYYTSKRLPGLSTDLDVVSIGLKQIYDVLPYTLAFMDKVKRVEIYDSRPNAQYKNYSITRSKVADEILNFDITIGQKNIERCFIYFKHKEVSTAFEIQNGTILPFPQEMATLFCGLPMIGSEKNGIPFIINSLAFEPTIEREGVEITPNDKKNIDLFRQSVELYKIVMDYAARKQLKAAYCLSCLSRQYNGQEGSANIFRRDFVPTFEKKLEESRVVESLSEKWITVKQMLLPYREGKPFDDLYKTAKELKYDQFPTKHSFKGWAEALDFTIFRNQKYFVEQFADNIASKEQIQTLVLYTPGLNAKEWLHKSLSVIAMEDESLLRSKGLFPNQKGNLKRSSELYVDNDVPKELKKIYNKLSNEEIEEQLLDIDFNDFSEIVNRKYERLDMARTIDVLLKREYTSTGASTSSFIIPLNELYKWINQSDLQKNELEEMFPWFYPKRATLFMDTFAEQERDYAFSIVQSGKIKALAALAESSIAQEELEYISKHPEKLSQLYAMMQDTIDDKKYADSNIGEYGETLVLDDLKRKYKKTDGYEVIHSAKLGEPRFDFEVKHRGTTIIYVDAKTTIRGLSNSDSVPFFMRRSQWEFLPTINEGVKYVIARVFKREGVIKYLQIKAE